MRIFLSILCLCLFTVPLKAQESRPLAIDLSVGEIDITTGFTGAQVVVFGVQNAPGDVVLTIKGPQSDVQVRRKQQVLGFWLNTDSMTFINVPGFYDFATNRVEYKLASNDVLAEHNIGIDSFSLSPKSRNFKEADRLRFEQALFQNRQFSSLFSRSAKTINFISQDLFRTELFLPANVPTGVYYVEAFLFNGGNIIAQDSRRLIVKQVGFSADVKRLSKANPLFYGIGVVLISLFFGWATTIIFKRD